MEPELINLEDWERFGEGRNGQSYYHKTDSTIVLKLNDRSWTKEKAHAEFRMSKAVHDLGVKCPEVYRFVTDGERFGYIAQRIKGKKSFSRMIADDPGRIPELASIFAARARELHSTQCDTTGFCSGLERSKAKIDSCKAIPDDVRAMLETIYKEFDATASTCLHGDFHPGNLISSESGEYWIDLGSFAYGDPMLDIINLYAIGHYTPGNALKELFHIGRRSFCRFADEFIKSYYGDKLDAEMMDRIKRMSLYKVSLSICSTPKSAFMFVPLLRGQNARFKFMSFIVRLLWPVLKKRP